MSQTVISLLAIGVYIPACSKKLCYEEHTIRCLDVINGPNKFLCQCNRAYGGLFCQYGE